MLPELQQSDLDDAALSALVTDLLALATLHEVRVKGAGERHADAAPLDLRAAIGRLRAGEVLAVQVRYGYAERAWIDTLTRTRDGVRLIRIEAPSGPAGAA
jgi:hypothetical protein